MLVLETTFFICNSYFFLKFIKFIFLVLNVIRIAVPIILIIKTTIDIYKKIINPNDKDGLNIVIKRFTACILIFLIPTIIEGFMGLVDIVFQNRDETNYKVSSCYVNANSNCINNIESYVNCSEYSDLETNKRCQDFRKCNTYHVITSGDTCLVTTVLDDKKCKDYNEDIEYNVFQEVNYGKNGD